MRNTEAEGDWLAGLDDRSKIKFLITLARELTIAGRASYVPQSEDLERPVWLRQINEIQHRVLACLSELLDHSDNISFQRSIAAWVLDQKDDSLADHLHYAWSRAKDRTNQ